PCCADLPASLKPSRSPAITRSRRFRFEPTAALSLRTGLPCRGKATAHIAGAGWWTAWSACLKRDGEVKGCRSQPLGQLNIGSPRVRDESDRGVRVRELAVGSIELDPLRLQILAEPFQVLDLESDVIERPALGAHHRSLRVGRKRQIHSRKVGGFV